MLFAKKRLQYNNNNNFRNFESTEKCALSDCISLTFLTKLGLDLLSEKRQTKILELKIFKFNYWFFMVFFIYLFIYTSHTFLFLIECLFLLFHYLQRKFASNRYRTKKIICSAIRKEPFVTDALFHFFKNFYI